MFPVGLDAYFLDIPSDEAMQVTNEVIRRSPHRRLPDETFDYRKDSTVSRLVNVEELAVNVNKLPSPGEPPSSHSLFWPNTPQNVSYDIPFGAKGLFTLFNSLLEAQRIQARALHEVEETYKQIEA